MLTGLTARSFRNLKSLRWEPGPGTHLLLGDNGAGKTSLLEAIYVVATTRSFRTAQIADCRRHGTEFFFLEGEVADQARSTLRVVWDQGKRIRLLNGKKSPLADHLAALPVVVWTAADGDLLTGSPEPRRRLLDRGVLGMRPAALASLHRYRQALKQKRQLLLDRGSRAAIESWNAVLAPAAAEVLALREAYALRLGEELVQALEESGLDLPPVEMVYRPSPTRGTAGVEAVEAGLREALGQERERRMPLVGPHRDDLRFRWSGRAVRRVASAGERKALGLLAMAAHGRVLEASGRRPIYLLDDVDAELSAKTLAAVWNVFGPSRQLVASSNRPSVWEGLRLASTWSLERGELRPAGGGPEDPAGEA